MSRSNNVVDSDVQRYYFGYYPPERLEGGVLPLDTEDKLTVLCPGLYYADTKVQSWLEAGDYVGQEDFWLAADPPKPSDCAEVDGQTLVLEKTHLRSATNVFGNLCFLIAAEHRPDSVLAREFDRRTWLHILRRRTQPALYSNPYDSANKAKVLIELQLLNDIYEQATLEKRVIPGLGKASMKLVERVLHDTDIEEEPTDLQES